MHIYKGEDKHDCCNAFLRLPTGRVSHYNMALVRVSHVYSLAWPRILAIIFTISLTDGGRILANSRDADFESEVFSLEMINQKRWQNCDVFMAPTNTSAGWGVFAARDFNQQELLDIPALYVPFERTEDAYSFDSRLVQSSALESYVYRVHRQHVERNQSLVLFGYDMVYNHHPTDPNVKICLGPGYSQGFCARTKIRSGEQLFSRYSEHDGGKSWFESRGLIMRSDKSNIQSPDRLDYLRSQYCTKIYAGPGPATFRQLIPPIDESRIAPFDAGLNDARAKVPIKAGQRIEQGPAMLMYKPFVKDTALSPLVISWNDLLQEHQDSIRMASGIMEGKLPIQYRGEASQWKRIRRMASVENVAILPFAGRIGLVRRVNTELDGLGSSNCRLEIAIDAIATDKETADVSVVLTLIATEDIDVGEVLRVDLKPGGTVYESELLKLKLSETGHPHEFGI